MKNQMSNNRNKKIKKTRFPLRNQIISLFQSQNDEEPQKLPQQMSQSSSIPPIKTYKFLSPQRNIDNIDFMKNTLSKEPFQTDLSRISNLQNPKVFDIDIKINEKSQKTLGSNMMKDNQTLTRLLEDFTFFLESNKDDPSQKNSPKLSEEKEKMSEVISISSGEDKKDDKFLSIKIKIDTLPHLREFTIKNVEVKNSFGNQTSEQESSSEEDTITNHIFHQSEDEEEPDSIEDRKYPKRLRLKPIKYWNNERIIYKNYKAVGESKFMRFYKKIGVQKKQNMKISIQQTINRQIIVAQILLKPQQILQSQGIQEPFTKLIVKFKESSKVICTDQIKERRVKKNDVLYVNPFTSFSIANKANKIATFQAILVK